MPASRAQGKNTRSFGSLPASWQTRCLSVSWPHIGTSVLRVLRVLRLPTWLLQQRCFDLPYFSASRLRREEGDDEERDGVGPRHGYLGSCGSAGGVLHDRNVMYVGIMYGTYLADWLIGSANSRRQAQSKYSGSKVHMYLLFFRHK